MLRAYLSVLLTGLVLAGCGAEPSRLPIQTHPSPQAYLTAGRPNRIAVIVMENKEYGKVLGARDAPYVNKLAKRYALATAMYAIRHPSLPNYLALTGGSTFGIDEDCTDCNVPGAALAGQLDAARISWRAYMEDLPRPCFAGADAGGYAKKHNPFAYYRGLGCKRRILPLSELAATLRARALPRFIWISPNQCHDTHDCDVATGDRFLSRLVPPLLGALGPRGLLFLTWDEGDSDAGCCRLASGGHIVTIVAGPGARPGARLRTPVDHYSTLQAIEDLFGLRRLGGAACNCTPSLQRLLR